MKLIPQIQLHPRWGAIAMIQHDQHTASGGGSMPPYGRAWENIRLDEQEDVESPHTFSILQNAPASPNPLLPNATAGFQGNNLGEKVRQKWCRAEPYTTSRNIIPSLPRGEVIRVLGNPRSRPPPRPGTPP